jgi:hypothetical protein
MNLEFRNAERKRVKLKMLVQGLAGSGKTYSSILLAYGITKDWSKIGLVDCEAGSSHLYANLGEYKVLTLNSYSPDDYIRCIEVAEKSNLEILILDGISPCWEYLLNYHASLVGNSFVNWSKVSLLQDKFVMRILNSNMHIICTARKKTNFVLKNENGKMIPERVGWRTIQRDGLNYHFSIEFDLDLNHFVTCEKDRTGLFSKKEKFIITPTTGEIILNWCESGIKVDDVRTLIKGCSTMEQLRETFYKYPEWSELLASDFAHQKKLLQAA